MQPPFQPSGNAPAAGGNARFTDPAKPTTLPRRKQATIGDRLDAKGVPWAWYAGAWNLASADAATTRSVIYKGKARLPAHHQPFNYYANFDPVTRGAYRAAHLKDYTSELIADARAGKLPAVTFYKPQGNLNQHAGYANLTTATSTSRRIIAELQRSPQWGTW